VNGRRSWRGRRAVRGHRALELETLTISATRVAFSREWTSLTTSEVVVAGVRDS
jgi:hypothetical protein